MSNAVADAGAQLHDTTFVISMSSSSLETTSLAYRDKAALHWLGPA